MNQNKYLDRINLLIDEKQKQIEQHRKEVDNLIELRELVRDNKIFRAIQLSREWLLT